MGNKVNSAKNINTKKALIKNIMFGVLSDADIYLGVNETKVVPYTQKIKNYAGKKLIKILKIY